MRYLVLGAFLQDKPISSLEDHAEVVLKKIQQLLPNSGITIDTTGTQLLTQYDQTSGEIRRRLDATILFPTPYAKQLIGHWEQLKHADLELQQHNRRNTEKLLATIAGIGLLTALFYTNRAYVLLYPLKTLSNSSILRGIDTVCSFLAKFLLNLVS